jgi:parvulin-like peptidyl-prolyl isomerase
MSRIACILAALLFVALVPPGTAFSQQPNLQDRAGNDQSMQIMAVVNGQQVTRQRLADESLRRFGELVIENMINNRLILMSCREKGIEVTDEDVTAELKFRAGKFGMSIEHYISLIGKERGIDEKRLRNEVIWTELSLRRLAESRITVADDAIQARMESEFGPKVQVRAIAVADPQLAQQLHAQAIANPEQFSRLAIENSVDPNSASVGGLLPPLRRNMGEPVIEKVAFSLTAGQISDVFQIADQFLFLKCERLYPGTDMNPEQVTLARERIREELQQEMLSEAAAGLFEEMQSRSEIVNVINDPGKAASMPGVAAIVNGSQITMAEVQEECIARFGEDVLQAEVNRLLITQRLEHDGLSVKDEDLQSEVARAAIEFGYVRPDGSADVDKWLAVVTNNDPAKLEIYVNDEVWPTVAMKKIVAKNVRVTEEDMEMGFQANFGPRVQVLAIVLQDQRAAQRVWEMAKTNPTESYFGELAHQYSVEPASRANYGEVPPIQMHGGRKVLEDEAFRLKPGEISGIVPVGSNWIVMLCKGRTNPVVTEFDSVKDELYRDILEKKMRIAMAEEFQQLQSTSQIDNFMAGTSQPAADSIRAAREQLQQPQAPEVRR